MMINPPVFRTAPDGVTCPDGTVRRRTEHMLRPQSNGTVRLALPAELRPDQWNAVVAAQAARLRAYQDRVVSDGPPLTDDAMHMTPAEAREFRRAYIDPDTLRLRRPHDRDGAVVGLSTGRSFRHERARGAWVLVDPQGGRP